MARPAGDADVLVALRDFRRRARYVVKVRTPPRRARPRIGLNGVDNKIVPWRSGQHYRDGVVDDSRSAASAAAAAQSLLP